MLAFLSQLLNVFLHSIKYWESGMVNKGYYNGNEMKYGYAIELASLKTDWFDECDRKSCYGAAETGCA